MGVAEGYTQEQGGDGGGLAVDPLYIPDRDGKAWNEAVV